MKKKITLIVLLIILLLSLVTAVYADRSNTYHWLLQNGDDAYVLCANGQFTIQVNGDDSIHIVCHGDERMP